MRKKRARERCSGARKWVFTWFNYEMATVDLMKKIFDGLGTYVMGFEKCPTTGKEHIQGYVHFKKAVRAIEKWPYISWAKAKGNDIENLRYCSKDGEFETNMKVVEKRVDIRLVNFVPRYWQEQVVNYLKTEPNDRHILWVYDLEGNKGKTLFAKWYYENNKDECVVVRTNKSSDIVTCIHDRMRVFMLDLPRGTSAGTFTPYTALEQILGGS